MGHLRLNEVCKQALVYFREKKRDLFLLRSSPSLCPPHSHLLQEEDDPLDHFGSLLLQAEEGAWRSDEDLGLAVGHVVVESAPLQEPLHGVLV